METYDANVLGGPGTLTDFLAQAEANPSNPALTAAAVNAYIEAGFALVVEQVTASPTSGVELPGNTITLSLKFGQAVTVTGTPTLTLNDGGTATYTGGSGTSALTFSYTVGATDNTVSALAITQANLPSGATITDTTGNPVNLSGAAVTFSGLQIDPPSGPKISSVVESPSSGDLNAGNTVTFTLNMAGAVTVAGGTPTLTLNDGGTASYTGGSGTSALTFSYTVAAGQNTAALAATAVNLNSATVNDGSGNPANFSLTRAYSERAADRHVDAVGVLGGGLWYRDHGWLRRPRGRQRSDADGQPERGGDSGGRDPDADAQRRRHSELYAADRGPMP